MFRPVRHRRKFLALVSLSALFAGACERDAIILPPRDAAPGAARQVAPPPALFDRPEERPLRDIAAQVPSFAGFFVDSAGQLVIMAVDSARDGAAGVAFVRNLMLENVHGTKRMPVTSRVVKARYTFLQLSGWRDLVTKNLFGESFGVWWDDADEVNNQVAIGIDGSKAAVTRALLASELSKLGIPSDAVRIVEEERPARTTATTSIAARTSMMTPTYTPAVLTNAALPLSGGQQVNVWWGATRQPSAGFVVRRSGTDYLVTAAHAARAGAVDSSLLSLSDNFGIGHEVYDPGLYFSAKYSDASLYSIDYAPYSGYGRVWRPNTLYGSTIGAININTSIPYFVVLGTQSSFWVNQDVHKVGAYSGWTHGSITATCMDHSLNDPHSGVTWTRLCSHRALYYAHEGDSGGPVFTWDGENGIYAAGIHFGVYESFGSWSYSIFSPWSGVTTDMSNFYGLSGFTPVTDMSMGTPSLTGSYVSGSSAVITWPAVSTANTTGTTTYKVFRTVWNAPTGSYYENGTLLTTTTGTSVTDGNPYFSVSSFNGLTYPGLCDYSFVSYYVKAYNSGLVTTSPVVYFIGPFNPDGCVG